MRRIRTRIYFHYIIVYFYGLKENHEEKKSDFETIEVETDKDHIHLMIQYIPIVSISSIVNRLKSVTTYHLWKKYKPFLKQHFWKENTFWTDGYFVCSVGEVSPETIQKYIQNQG